MEAEKFSRAKDFFNLKQGYWKMFSIKALPKEKDKEEKSGRQDNYI